MAVSFLQVLLVCSALAVVWTAEDTHATCDGASGAACARQHALSQDVGEGGEGTSWLSLKALEVQKEDQNASWDGHGKPPIGPIENCITEPEEFAKEWKTVPHVARKPRCVCSQLWGTVMACNAKALQLDGAATAWIFGRVNLELLLEIQQRDGKGNPSKVSSAAYVLDGFAPPSLDGAIAGRCLAVFTLPEGKQAVNSDLVPQIPVYTFWFYRLSEYKFNIPYEVQKAITIKYQQTGPATNPLDIFQDITGCDRDSIQVGEYDDCKQSVLRVKDALTPYFQKGLECVKVFFDGAGPGKWSIKSAADVRMMMWQCYSVTPYNTGTGLGWNYYPNPLVCTPPDEQPYSDRYTGQEYVISNTPIATLPKFTSIDFAPVSKAQNTRFTTRGFC
mmetsp:Transcript_86163/g.257157  ORF Transcript_86163/g.257157 Transcript_86163/m.257157 type:complete len:390 (-) Transcript_86163:76-1245(-)|eukprot:CAMPEP_0175233528 /NCGR_PEP_ID=MMETSP0093-20121207/26515_1 /TAXON_ID=311494 /ORGANISM="Alexandrium monilatum, Strain CCMP3105" /LENGTH=389 /DNA_ID=CAMNT_0016527407 /DNA_START=55 /DNA_END=1224 /DNA_ORIENTATION=-